MSYEGFEQSLRLNLFELWDNSFPEAHDNPHYTTYGLRLKVSWGHYLNFDPSWKWHHLGFSLILGFPNMPKNQVTSTQALPQKGANWTSPSKCHSKHCLFVGTSLSSLKWLLLFPNLHHIDEMRFPIPCHSRQGSAAMASSSSLCIFLVGRGETLMSIPWKGTFNIEATINIHQPWIINHGHVRNCFLRAVW